MISNLIVLLPGKTSAGFKDFIFETVKDFPNKIITRATDIPSLQNKNILWAIELNEFGFNISMEEMLQAICKKGQGALKNSQGAIIVQSPLEFWTKYCANRIIFQTNQLGCRYMGHSAVEATKDLVNFLTWQKHLNQPLLEIYKKNSHNLVTRLMQSSKMSIKKPEVLILYSNPRKTSNTMMLWQMVKKHIPYNDDWHLMERHVENGTIVDCRGCLYKTCLHYSERKSCFYGGIVVQEILPAIEKADYLIWLCPNYNDSVSAKLMAVINRLTVLYKRVNFYKKSFFSIIVSGNSGSENVAMQLIGALNVNKGFHLPPYFCLMAIANDPGTVKKIPNIEEKVRVFAWNMSEEIGI
jgi:multimeric flavodoxin WrbA